MLNKPTPSDFYTLTELVIAWDRGELTFEEVLQRWPHPKATRQETLRDILRVVLILRQRIAALDGISGW